MKPYVPKYDIVQNSTYPLWIDDSPVKPFEKVLWNDNVLDLFEKLFLEDSRSSKFYPSFSQLKEAIEQVIKFILLICQIRSYPGFEV
jgi:hypothetical protein